MIKMKDLLQEGRNIQETFKKNVNELEQTSMFPERTIDILGKKCPICEKGTIRKEFAKRNVYSEIVLKCDNVYPPIYSRKECAVNYLTRYPLENDWVNFEKRMKMIPKDDKDDHLINGDRRAVYRKEFYKQFESNSKDINSNK